MTTVWVVGAGGLLGSKVAARVRERGHALRIRSVPWEDARRARLVLREEAETLVATGDPWAVAWCAGAGVVATSAEVVAAEQAQFEHFLADFRPRGSGAFFLASSAGGVYAGSASLPPFDERTPPRPLAPYGHGKLAMERALTEWAAATGTPALIGRIANLYGPGQDLAKGQGLVSQICRSSITGKALSVYVSLDTRRDYLFVADAAAMIVAALEQLPGRGDPVTVKILASGRSATIGTLVGEARRVLRRRPRVVFGASPKAAAQVRDLRLRSVVWRELDTYARTPLPVGLAATAADLTHRHARLP